MDLNIKDGAWGTGPGAPRPAVGVLRGWGRLALEVGVAALGRCQRGQHPAAPPSWPSALVALRGVGAGLGLDDGLLLTAAARLRPGLLAVAGRLRLGLDHRLRRRLLAGLWAGRQLGLLAGTGLHWLGLDHWLRSRPGAGGRASTSWLRCTAIAAASLDGLRLDDWLRRRPGAGCGTSTSRLRGAPVAAASLDGLHWVDGLRLHHWLRVDRLDWLGLRVDGLGDGLLDLWLLAQAVVALRRRLAWAVHGRRLLSSNDVPDSDLTRGADAAEHVAARVATRLGSPDEPHALACLEDGNEAEALSAFLQLPCSLVMPGPDVGVPEGLDALDELAGVGRRQGEGLVVVLADIADLRCPSDDLDVFLHVVLSFLLPAEHGGDEEEWEKRGS